MANQTSWSERRWNALAGALKGYYRSEPLRHGFQLVLWQSLSQLMLFFGSSWMVRCLGPRNLGVSAVVLSTVNFFALLINLGLSFTGARALATDKSGCRDIIELVMGIRLRMAIGLFVLWLLASLVLALLHVPNAGAWAIGSLVFLATAPNPQWVLQGLGNLPFYSRTLALGSAITASCYLLFFRPGFGAGSDIFVNAMSTFVVLWITWKYIRKQVGARLLCAISYPAAWDFVKKGRYAFGGALMLYFYNQFDVVLISYFTDPAHAGFFRAANTFTSPMALLVSVSDAVLFPRLAVMHKEAPTKFLKNSARLSGLYAIIAVPTALLAVPLCSLMVTLLFGSKYAPAVVPAQLLIVSSCISIVCGPFRWGLMAANRDGVFFLNSAVIAVTAVGLDLLLVPHYGANGAALARLLSQLLLLVTSGVLCYRFFKA